MLGFGQKITPAQFAVTANGAAYVPLKKDMRVSYWATVLDWQQSMDIRIDAELKTPIGKKTSFYFILYFDYKIPRDFMALATPHTWYGGSLPFRLENWLTGFANAWWAEHGVDPKVNPSLFGAVAGELAAYIKNLELVHVAVKTRKLEAITLKSEKPIFCSVLKAEDICLEPLSTPKQQKKKEPA